MFKQVKKVFPDECFNHRKKPAAEQYNETQDQKLIKAEGFNLFATIDNESKNSNAQQECYNFNFLNHESFPIIDVPDLLSKAQIYK
jgi:hypothetical protein